MIVQGLAGLPTTIRRRDLPASATSTTSRPRSDPLHPRRRRPPATVPGSGHAAGESFVLLGLPGTGKSQTIANLIADHVARGKHVLVVAKRWRLSTSSASGCARRPRRLSAWNCTVPSKAASTVVTELVRCLPGSVRLNTTRRHPARMSPRLKDRRDQLNRYVRDCTRSGADAATAWDVLANCRAGTPSKRNPRSVHPLAVAPGGG